MTEATARAARGVESANSEGSSAMRPSQSAALPIKHNLPVPWLDIHSFASPLSLISNSNKKALQWWLDRASHILAFDPDGNPLSFPIMAHISASQALLHALQSLSIAHQYYFDQSCIPTSLAERSRALILIQQELQSKSVPLATSFLSIFIVGVASSWTYPRMQDDFGKEHLKGGRAVIDLMLDKWTGQDDHTLGLMLGYYLYWDMHCAFLVPCGELKPLDTPELARCAEAFEDLSHPLAGCSLRLFYHLGILGRYCRKVLETMEHDYEFEERIEAILLSWQPVATDPDDRALSRAYQLQGLIFLYRICGRSHRGHLEDEEAVILQLETEEIVRKYSKEILQPLMATPFSKASDGFYGLILITAGSELGNDDISLQLAVKDRLKAMYSWVRINTVLWAIDLLEVLWALREAGVMITPLELMLQRNWMLTMV